MRTQALRDAIKIIKKARQRAIMAAESVEIPEWSFLYDAQRHLERQEKESFDEIFRPPAPISWLKKLAGVFVPNA